MPRFQVLDGALAVARGLVHARQVVVHERPIRVARQLGEQQRLVAGALVGAVALVAVVVDGDAVEGLDPQARRPSAAAWMAGTTVSWMWPWNRMSGRLRHSRYSRNGRPPDPGHEAHPERDAVGRGVEVRAGVVEVAAHLLVGVDVEDPVAGGEVEAAVARAWRSRPATARARRPHRAASATATERSVEPVSTTTISSTSPRRDVRQASSRSASSLTMMAADSDTAPDRYADSRWWWSVGFGCVVVVVDVSSSTWWCWQTLSPLTCATRRGRLRVDGLDAGHGEGGDHGHRERGADRHLLEEGATPVAQSFGCRFEVLGHVGPSTGRACQTSGA